MASSSDALLHGICLIVAYDGSDFAGYQRQPHARTVQGELERAVASMTGHPTRVRAASRTDAGVHALGQVVAFDSARAIPPLGFMRGLNRALPPEIRVQRAAACPAGYQPRFEAVAKTYRYLLQLGEAQDPLLRLRAYHLAKCGTLDLENMRAAARAMIGTHDYRAFRAADDLRENTVRTLHAIEIQEGFAGDARLLTIEVRGSAFMKNMVRILAGTLVDLGRGRIPLARVPSLLGANAIRSQAGHTAPAHGLTLMEIELGRTQPSPFDLSDAPS